MDAQEHQTAERVPASVFLMLGCHALLRVRLKSGVFCGAIGINCACAKGCMHTRKPAKDCATSGKADLAHPERQGWSAGQLLLLPPFARATYSAICSFCA
eukprot:6468115-Amphidinium_carterae.1